MEIGFNEQPDYEYLENDQSTWHVRSPLPVPDWFQAELIRLGGLNPYNQPNLVAHWAGHLKSDRSVSGGLKYHCGWTPQEVSGYRYQVDGEWKFATNIDHLDKSIMVIPAMGREELGLLRFVIERWTSPAELEAQNRFTQISDNGVQYLTEFPRQGIYDTYFIVETKEGKFRPLDSDVLIYLKSKWQMDKKTFDEQEEIRDEVLKTEQTVKESVYKERMQAIVDGDLTLPKDEIEKRDEYWERVHDYREDVGRY